MTLKIFKHLGERVISIRKAKNVAAAGFPLTMAMVRSVFEVDGWPD